MLLVWCMFGAWFVLLRRFLRHEKKMRKSFEKLDSLLNSEDYLSAFF